MSKKYSLLIADDEPFVLNLIEQILESENYKLYTAYDGKKALK